MKKFRSALQCRSAVRIIYFDPATRVLVTEAFRDASSKRAMELARRRVNYLRAEGFCIYCGPFLSVTILGGKSRGDH